jgi:hypothetical protein
VKPPKLVLLAARTAGRISARVESVVHGGWVTATSVECRDCGRWVPANDWNPFTAVCEVCTLHVAAEAQRNARLRSAGAGYLDDPAFDGWSL